jgi:hypothetical protein
MEAVNTNYPASALGERNDPYSMTVQSPGFAGFVIVLLFAVREKIRISKEN